MTRVTLVRWTCNMCLIVVEIERAQQPDGWVGYGFTQPDYPADIVDDLGHLCGDCHNDVQGLIDKKRRENTTTVVGGRLTFGDATIHGGLVMDGDGTRCATCDGDVHGVGEACPKKVVHRADWTAGDARPICLTYEYAGHDYPCRVKA